MQFFFSKGYTMNSYINSSAVFHRPSLQLLEEIMDAIMCHVLTKLAHDGKITINKGLNVGVALMHLSKAFDCVPHGLLCTKLIAGRLIRPVYH